MEAEIVLLADRPELAAGWAELHWREWGTEPGREALAWWVADAERAMEREQVPVAFVAVDGAGAVLGGVGIHEFDLVERRDRSPWVVGTIVRADLRGAGIGQALMSHLAFWAIRVGIPRLWVATEHARAFYERRGFQFVEELAPQRGEVVSVLTQQLTLRELTLRTHTQSAPTRRA